MSLNRSENHGGLFILDSSGGVLYPQTGDFPLSDEARGRILERPEEFHGFTIGDGFGTKSFITRSERFAAWDWIIGVAAMKSEVFRPISNATGGALAVFVVVALLSFTVLLLISRAMARPLSSLLEATRYMATGDLSARAEIAGRDEFGDLARSYNRMADSLQEFNARLEQRVAERTEELESSLEALRDTQHQLVESEKMAALGSLVAGIAHEINTPLGVGVTAASFLKRRAEEFQSLFGTRELSRTDLQDFLKSSIDSSVIISRNLERAHTLISSFKQLAMDQSSEEPRRFLLASYLQDIVLSLKPELNERSAEIELECDESIEMEGLPGLLAQVVTNLVMNSLVHGFGSDPGGKISLRVHSDGLTIHLHYTDNGRGMDAVTLKHLYEPFYTTRRGHGGSGLGMNIVYTIVTQKFHGSIEVESEPGEGVRYDIRFPVGL